ncbi:MAG TPA: dTDP-4-dehydrorhamnose reductase, partial [Spirochaetota bacterium]|nr:dTDP-4-dehydrorhamnose reductase [Spirochaetota bacterium]HOR45550.1 dTDP-4-dehydrorhamnose reductase [Spirochaetota bacterium]HPK57133.1 dTDP-4-dehydrorhamnose reductase [Spirochaetota bacterium]
WIIGCNGMLGREVSELFQKNKIPFIGTDIECDITDISALAEFAKDKNIKWIINCSAYTNVDKSEEEEPKAYSINASGAANIAQTASLIGAKLIHISTDYVFNGKGNSPYKESDAKQPLGAYGRTKSAGEDFVAEKTDKYFIIRTAWLYGKNGNNFVHTMLRLFAEKDSLNVVVDQKGTPTWAGTLASLLMTIIQTDSDKYGIYHCTDEGETTWFDFACAIQEYAFDAGLISKKIPINPVSSSEYPTKTERPKYSVLSKEKIKNEFSFIPRSWDAVLNDYIKVRPKSV